MPAIDKVPVTMHAMDAMSATGARSTAMTRHVIAVAAAFIRNGKRASRALSMSLPDSLPVRVDMLFMFVPFVAPVSVLFPPFGSIVREEPSR